MEKIVVLAIPLYFGSMFLEAWWSTRTNKGHYKLKDSLGNLGTGILMQMLEVFTLTFLVGLYSKVLSVASIPGLLGLELWTEDFSSIKGVFTWIFTFFAVDFVYWLFHKHCHEVNFLWAAHSVHHSSEHYNFSVALRQSSFQSIFSSLYITSLALLGLPPKLIAACFGLNLIYQFFLHTRLVKKLGFLELVLNTPSHHRVHHARQTKYLDSNYAGVFIIWDRLFGTFIEEKDEPKYGVYPRFQSYDPVRANFLPYVELWTYFKASKGADKWRVLFKGPLWLYENHKKGKNLNILEVPGAVTAKAWAYFILSLTAALVVLFVPQLSFTVKLTLALTVALFLKLMGSSLDAVPEKVEQAVPVVAGQRAE